MQSYTCDVMLPLTNIHVPSQVAEIRFPFMISFDPFASRGLMGLSLPGLTKMYSCMCPDVFVIIFFCFFMLAFDLQGLVFRKSLGHGKSKRWNAGSQVDGHPVSLA